MKLGWRLQAERSSLWARIPRQKYCKGSERFNLAVRQYACSNVWKGIMGTRALIEQGMGSAVGDDKHTKFWTERWIDGKKLADHATQVVPEEHIHKQVCDYWRLSTGWDWATLKQFLPAELL